MVDAKCKICRRMGTKLFLKGDKCLSSKCPMVKRPYPPGPQRKKRRHSVSDYGKDLREKQKVRSWYNLRESQFKKYVKEILEHRGKEEDKTALLIQNLEKRLDNAIFRLGFSKSRAQARQMVSHGHFLVNKKKIDIPSYRVKKGDKISVRSSSIKKAFFKETPSSLGKFQPPSWLKLDKEKMKGEVLNDPLTEEVALPAEISSVFEFYSR